jgi:hypothetical protein
MSIKRQIVAFASYIAVTFAWAIIWNLVFFKETYSALAVSAYRSEPIIPLGFVAIVIQAITITYLFGKFFPLAPTLKTALMLTVGFGVFLITYAALVVPAKFAVSPTFEYVALELVFEIIHFVLIGLMFFSIFRNVKSV